MPGATFCEGIDSAIERTRDAMKEAGSEAQTQVADWRSSLDKASEDVRRELGILAVRAQRSPESLRAMSAEIRKRKTELTPSSDRSGGGPAVSRPVHRAAEASAATVGAPRSPGCRRAALPRRLPC